ncbi:MAG: protein arginine kinase [Candidatus Sumerlaeia bacterium]
MEQLLRHTDKWLQGSGPHEDVVVSSRARYARNLRGYPFAARGDSARLQAAALEIDARIKECPYFHDFQKIVVTEVRPLERACLKESRLISVEVEKGAPHQIVYISSQMNQSIMVNEEDHIRLQAILPGLQIQEALKLADRMDEALSHCLDFAFSEKWGYLTACPTNTGTGLRVSVMLHLPGLVIQKRMDEILKLIQPFGLIARGFWGENSDHTGDFFQISNELTLGKREEEIAEILSHIAGRILEQELEARTSLFRENEIVLDDFVWRSFGQLRFARRLETSEAMKLLSCIRLGISRGYFKDLTHKQFNQIIVAIQPGHLQAFHGGDLSSESRDAMRAQMLRQRLIGCVSNN